MQGTTSTVPVAMGAESISASISLEKVTRRDGTSQDIEQALTTTFEAEDYPDYMKKNLWAQGVNSLEYI